jgi:exosortase
MTAGRWVVYFPFTVIALLAGVTWVYWSTLTESAERWANDPQYSHGYLVPAFAVALLYLRRRMVSMERLLPSWWGLPLLAAGIGMRLIGTYYYYVWLDAVSLLPCLAGLGLMMGGAQVLRWAWPAIAFLVFMIPLPYRLEVMLGEPLQRLATAVSTFSLQTLGLPALAEGTTILLNDVRINIVEACSGLRMLVIFTALASAVALLVRRPLWEKLIILSSAVPIALISNITRITVTGVLHHRVGSAVADAVFHDLAGWLMMPFALGLLAAELVVLKHLFIDPPPGRDPLGMGFTGLPPSFNQPRRPWKGATAPPPAAEAAAPLEKPQARNPR